MKKSRTRAGVKWREDTNLSQKIIKKFQRAGMDEDVLRPPSIGIESISGRDPLVNWCYTRSCPGQFKTLSCLCPFLSLSISEFGKPGGEKKRSRSPSPRKVLGLALNFRGHFCFSRFLSSAGTLRKTVYLFSFVLPSKCGPDVRNGMFYWIPLSKRSIFKSAGRRREGSLRGKPDEISETVELFLHT